ncbi:MAG: type II toxin-antitoxin system RelE/ParE family toxin [Coriobacteriia bacterium]|nr:type II toxin-antitoxin system RelE/ParE family toxin [Coriobacteriia bacterium]
MKVTWAPLAENQVADAFTFIAAERPSAALKWFERVVSATESLSLLPDQGRMVPESDRESIRKVLVDPYRIIYRRDENEVVILRSSTSGAILILTASASDVGLTRASSRTPEGRLT